MILLLQRFSSGPDSTLGALFELSNGSREFECFTLEDEYREIKVPDETRIPAGTYEIILRAAGTLHNKYAALYNWHRGMLWLQDVPNFTWIYIHPGNTDLHTSGCILVGDGCNSNVVARGNITNSLTAYQRLYESAVTALLAGEQVWIQVEDYA